MLNGLESLVVNLYCSSVHVTLKDSGNYVSNQPWLSKYSFIQADYYLGLITKGVPSGMSHYWLFSFVAGRGQHTTEITFTVCKVNSLCLIELILKLVMAFEK